MRLKEIEPGMAILCENEEQGKAVEMQVRKQKVKWNGSSSEHYREEDNILYISNSDNKYSFSRLFIANTKFSDLILPELTAEEAIKTYAEICIGRNCNMCPINVIRKGYSSCNKLCFEQPEKVVEFLEQWKSDHTKKEPEIETVDICRIIEVLPDGRKRCVHEEDLASGSTDAEIKILVEAELKRYIQNHDGEFIAVHEVVSRAKK